MRRITSRTREGKYSKAAGRCSRGRKRHPKKSTRAVSPVATGTDRGRPEPERGKAKRNSSNPFLGRAGRQVISLHKEGERERGKGKEKKYSHFKLQFNVHIYLGRRCRIGKERGELHRTPSCMGGVVVGRSNRALLTLDKDCQAARQPRGRLARGKKKVK